MKRGAMTPIGTMPQATVTENLRHQGCPVQVRWDFKEEQQELEEGQTQTVWTFAYDNMVEKWNRLKVYAKEETCWLNNGKVYVSEIDNNKNKPPQSGWKEIVFEGITKAEEQEAKTWVPVTGAHDVYKLGEVVEHSGKKYVSNHPANSWEPGTLTYLNLWIEIGAAESNEILPWVQPTGAHDAYQKGDRVLFEGKTYESLIDANVWSPTSYPQGWKEI
jgi:hypothetical protein